MKLKVGFCNKKFWDFFVKVVGLVYGPISIILVFFDINDQNKIIFICILLGLFIIIFIFAFGYANKKRVKKFNINQVNFEIKYGDIFTEKGIKTISFNEYFDTKVDEKIISSKSLNGIFLKANKNDIPSIDNNILKNLKKYEVGINNSRQEGKKIKYKLGTVYKYSEDFAFVAFAKVDENYCATLTLDEYLNCLVNYWIEINKVYNGNDIILPLIGSGLTRLKELSCQEKLEILIQTFKWSNLSFRSSINIKIVLHEDLKEKINLFDLNI